MKDHEWMKYSVGPWWWRVESRSDAIKWYSEMITKFGHLGANALYGYQDMRYAEWRGQDVRWKNKKQAIVDVAYSAWAASGQHTTLLTLPVMKSLWGKRLVSQAQLDELPLTGAAFEVVFHSPISVSGGRHGGVRFHGKRRDGYMCAGGLFHGCPVDGWRFIPNLMYSKHCGSLIQDRDTQNVRVDEDGFTHKVYRGSKNDIVKGGPPTTVADMHGYATQAYLEAGFTVDYSPNALLLNALRALHDRRVAYTEPFLASPRKRKKSSRRVKNPARLSILVLGPKAESVYQIRSNRVGTDEPSKPRKPMCRHQVQAHTTIKWVLTPRPDEEVIERRIRRSAVVDGETIHTYIYAVRRVRKGFARGVGEPVFTPKLTILQGS